MSERDKTRPPYLPLLPPSWPTVPDFVPPLPPVIPSAESIAPPDILIPQEHTSVLPTPEPTAKPEQQRIVLSGRVGRAPVFGTTPSGKPKATFPLATHPTPETTEWKRIVAFQERAERLRGRLAKGDEVEVIGYARVRQVPTKAGGTRPVEEIYATVVRTPKQPGK